jgi:hypothetical protein
MKDNVWNLVNFKNYAAADLRVERLDICAQCPALNKIQQCTYCHCFVAAKTWLEDSKCPIGKW